MFKWLLDNSLTNRLLVIIASVVLMAYGAFTLSRTPVDVFPDLNKPTVTIMTEAGGMAAEEVEQLITFPLETTMNGLPGVESVRSTSSAGLSFLYVTFDWNTDIFRARQLVAERLASMEEGIAEGVVPRMGPISSIMGEIMQIAIPVDPSKISAMAVREYADWVLRPRLLSVPGVAQVIPIGGEVRQFQVQPNTTRMAELGITHDQLEGALKGYSHCAYLTWSTGIGVGLCVDGYILRGKNGNAGHAGHMFVCDDDGQALCGCGNVGDVEGLASGNAMERRWGVDAQTLLGQATQGDDCALAKVDALCRVLGRTLYNLIATLDLQAISLGGSVFLHHQALLLPRLRAQVYGKLGALTDDVLICPAGLGADVGDYAALALVGNAV